MTEASNLRRTITEKELALNSAKALLKQIETACNHKWSELVKITVPRTEIRNGALIQHGVDFWYQPEPYVVHDPAWERTCLVCGKVEVTTRTEDVVTKKPVF